MRRARSLPRERAPGRGRREGTGWARTTGQHRGRRRRPRSTLEGAARAEWAVPATEPRRPGSGSPKRLLAPATRGSAPPSTRDLLRAPSGGSPSPNARGSARRAPYGLARGIRLRKDPARAAARSDGSSPSRLPRRFCERRTRSDRRRGPGRRTRSAGLPRRAAAVRRDAHRAAARTSPRRVTRSRAARVR